MEATISKGSALEQPTTATENSGKTSSIMAIKPAIMAVSMNFVSPPFGALFSCFIAKFVSAMGMEVTKIPNWAFFLLSLFSWVLVCVS